MVKVPPGTTTISGQPSQSEKAVSDFGVSAAATPPAKIPKASSHVLRFDGIARPQGCSHQGRRCAPAAK
jgi:hypothetical protein